MVFTPYGNIDISKKQAGIGIGVIIVGIILLMLVLRYVSTSIWGGLTKAPGELFNWFTTDTGKDTWTESFEAQKVAAETRFAEGITKISPQGEYVETRGTGVGGGAITRWFENVLPSGDVVIAPASVRAENLDRAPRQTLGEMSLTELQRVGNIVPPEFMEYKDIYALAGIEVPAEEPAVQKYEDLSTDMKRILRGV